MRAYSCLECPVFIIHLRCSTMFGIWDGIKLIGIPENTLEVKSYEMIEEGLIKHFSHEDHTVKLNEDANDKCMWCKACNYHILFSPFYSCMECKDFILHKKCAYLPKKKIHPFYKMSTTLTPILSNYRSLFICEVFQNISEGFCFKTYDNSIILDVRYGSISELFVHESHPLHSIYINYST